MSEDPVAPDDRDGPDGRLETSRHVTLVRDGSGRVVHTQVDVWVGDRAPMEQSAILAEALTIARDILPGRGDDLRSEITTPQELERLFSEGTRRDGDKSADGY